SEVVQHLERVAHDLVGAPPLDVHDEADATGVPLVRRVVQALLLRRSHGRFRRDFPPVSRAYRGHWLELEKLAPAVRACKSPWPTSRAGFWGRKAEMITKHLLADVSDAARNMTGFVSSLNTA